MLALAAGLSLLHVPAQAQQPAHPLPRSQAMSTSEFRGVYTVIYRVPDLERAKAWYRSAFGVEPYFDEPFYVGFSIRGYELGLLPVEGEDRAGPGGVVAYWGVENAERALARLLELGAAPHEAVQDVGGGVRVATVRDPFGNVLGIIENPGFRPERP